MNRVRRAFLTCSGKLAGIAVALAAGMVKPIQLWAAEWNKAGFESKTSAEVLKNIGAANAQPSNDVLIKAPDLAEDGAAVPIEVTSRIAGTRSIAIVAEKNPFPLVANFVFAAGAEGYASTRIKLAETSIIRVLVKVADGKSYAASKEIKVTIGGCGV